MRSMNSRILHSDACMAEGAAWLATAEPRFDICYGVSDNHHRWVDLEHSRERLGYVAQDGL